MAVSIGELVGYLSMDTEGITKGLKTAGKSLESFGRDFLPVSAAMAAAGAGSLFMASKFEESITRMHSLAGITKEDMDVVRDHIMALAPATGIGPQALADAMMGISSTVSNTSTALEILDSAARLSAAGMGEAKDIGKALTAVVNSYGEKNITAAKAADILTQAVKDGGAEASELAPTLANVVPMAAQMGIKFEEVAANIATFTKLGVPASEAVTSLSAVMTALLKPTAEGEAALHKIGMSFGELRQEVKDKGLAAAMTNLSEKFGDNKTAMADVFGRVEALRNVMGTAGQQAEKYAEEVDNMAKSTNKAGEVFDAVKNSTAMTWNSLIAQTQVLAIQLGDKLAPSFKQALDAAMPVLNWAIDAVKWFGELPEWVKTTVIAFGAFVAVLGPLAIALGSVVSAAAALGPVLTAAGVALTASTAPMWGTVAAATALFAIVYKLTSAFIEASPALQNFLKKFDDLDGVQAAANAEMEKGVSATAKWTEAQWKSHDAFVEKQKSMMGANELFDGLTQNTDKLAKATDKTTDAVKKSLPITNASILAKVKEAAAADKLKQASDLMGQEIKELTVAENVLRIAHANSAEGIKEAAKEAEEAAKRIDMMTESFKELSQNNGMVVSGLRAVTAETSTATKTVLPLNVAIRQQVNETIAAEKAAASHANVIRDVIMAMEGLTEAEKKHLIETLGGTEATKESNKYLEGSLNALSMLADSIGGKLGGAIHQGIGAWDTYTQDMAQATTKSEKFAAKANLAAAAVGILGDMLSSKGTPNAAKFGGALSGAAQGAKMGTAILPGWGTAIGAVVGGIAGFIVGGQKLTKQINDMRDAFFASQGGFEAFNAKMSQISNEDWSKKIFNAKSVEEFNKLVTEAKELLDMQGESQQALADAMDRYGLKIEDMGPRFAAQELDKKAMQLYQDWELLNKTGADHLVILEKMAPEISKYVDEAVASGVAIPKAMKATIDEMYKAGKLIHENGEAYTQAEYEGLSYTETMSEQFSTLIEKLDKWISMLLGIPTEVNTKVNTNYTSTGDPNGNTGDHGHGQEEGYDHSAAGGLDIIVRKPTEDILAHQGERVVIGDPSDFAGQKKVPNEDVVAAIANLNRTIKSSMDPFIITKAMRDGMDRKVG